MIIKDISGNSGCKVFLINKGNYSYITKISPDIKYNKRLKNQIDKLQYLKKKYEINTPEIYKYYYNENNLLCYDMEFIKGINFAEFIAISQVSEIKDKFNEIINFIKICTEDKNENKISNNVLKKK